METTFSQLESAFILSAFAYLPPEQLIEQVKEKFGDQETVKFVAVPSPYDNYAFITHNQQLNRYTLAIRGSVPFNALNWGGFYNWISEDFNVFKQQDWPYSTSTASPAPRLSDGSLLALNQLLSLQDDPTICPPGPNSGTPPSVYSLLKNAADQGSQILITGHSLGGNMANSFAVYFAQQLKQVGLPTDKVFLISIAAPASGNPTFAAMLDEYYRGQQSYHYELEGDIVPKFPVYDQITSKLTALYSSLAPNNAGVPDAQSIDLIFNLTLADGFDGLAAAIATSYSLDPDNAYCQPQNNYQTQDYPAPASFPNTVEGYIQEAKPYHSLTAYTQAFATPAVNQLIAQIKPLVPAYRDVL